MSKVSTGKLGSASGSHNAKINQKNLKK